MGIPMLEMPCPEYYATHIGRIESAGGGTLRVYMCVRRGNVLEPRFTVVMPNAELAHCARAALFAAADVRNEPILSIATTH